VTGHPDNTLVPRAVLFGNPERVAVEISPDGKHISWLAPKDGVMNVWVAPIDKLDAAKPITKDTTRPIRQYFWAFDNKHVLYSQDAGGDENFHVFRTSLDGSDAVDLTPYDKTRADVFGLSEKHPSQIAIGMNDRDAKVFDAYTVDLQSGKRTLVVQNDEGFAGYDFDNDLVLRAGTRSLPDGSNEISLRKGGKWEKWDTIPFEDNTTTGTAGFDGTNKKIYMNDSRGRDTAGLYAVDIATKAKTMIAEDAGADVGATIEHPTKHTVQAVSFNRERVKWKVLDASIQPDVDGLTKLAEGGDWGLVSRTLDDKTWIVAVSADTSPAKYYVWNRTKHAGTFLFAARPNVPSDKLGHQYPITIKARDGLPLVSYLTLPHDHDQGGKPDQPIPMLLLVHGGPWARDQWGYSSIDQLLANRGYAVLQVNYRGSTGFGKAFINAADGQWSKKMHDDLLDAVQWAIDNKVTPKDKVGIIGGSYGGYATLVGLTLTPDTFACGVDLVGPSNLKTLLATVPPYWAPLLATFKKRIGDADTKEGNALIENASPLHRAAKITKPLLIGQGANDPRVKQAEAQQIVDAMKQHHLPVTYVLFPDEGHGFARPENNIAFFGMAEAFLSAHLGGNYLPLSKEELAASSAQIKEGREGVPGL